MVFEGQFKIGPVAYKMSVDEKDDMEAMHKVIVISNPPNYCTLCQNNSFFALDTHKASSDKGTFTYIECVCKKCGAKSNLGQYKAGGYFWKKFEKYEVSKEQNG